MGTWQIKEYASAGSCSYGEEQRGSGRLQETGGRVRPHQAWLGFFRATLKNVFTQKPPIPFIPLALLFRGEFF